MTNLTIGASPQIVRYLLKRDKTEAQTKRAIHKKAKNEAVEALTIREKVHYKGPLMHKIYSHA